MIRRYLLLTALLTAPTARAADLDPLLPEDTQSVLNVNVRQIVDSPLVRKHILPLAQALRGNDQIRQDFIKDLGFDPYKDLDRVLIATPFTTEENRGLYILHGRFDGDKFQTRRKEAAKKDPNQFKIHKVLDGKHTLHEVYYPDVKEKLYVALAGRDTLLASGGKDYVVAALKKVGRTEKPTLKNRKFQALLEKVDPRQSLSLTALADPDARPNNAQSLVARIRAMSGGLTIGDDIKAELVVTAQTAVDAKKLRDSARNGLRLLVVLAVASGGGDIPEVDLVVEFIKSLRVGGKDDVVVIKGHLSGDRIEETSKKSK